MEKTWRWTNPYIDKLHDLPDILIAGKSNDVSEQQIKDIRSFCAKFKACKIELGSGSGGHLVQRAKQDPETAYIGFELRFKRSYRTAEKAKKLNLNNLLLVRTNAFQAWRIFEPQSINGCYVNFPDPWEKKKWKKHRLLNPDSLKQLHTILKPDSFLSYKTDHEEYFLATLKLLESDKNFSINKKTKDLHQSEYDTENVMTEFESLFVSKGLPIYFLEALKV